MATKSGFEPIAVALAVLVVPPLVHADEGAVPHVTIEGHAERAADPATGYRATNSSTFTKTDTPLKEVPASITVVPEQLMKDQAMQSLGDVFRYVPGVLMHQGEGNRDQVILRGNSTTADFFVDGIRDDAQVFRDLYNLERVEVLKGPGGMVFGRGGAGGVVNRVTKRPVFDHVGASSVALASYNQLRGTLDIGNKLSDFAAWAIECDGRVRGEFSRRYNLKRYAVNPTATLLLGDRTSVTLGYEHLHDERTADRGSPRSTALRSTRPRVPFRQCRPEQCALGGRRNLRRARA
jgi:catecholate siderophore receptor